MRVNTGRASPTTRQQRLNPKALCTLRSLIALTHPVSELESRP